MHAGLEDVEYDAVGPTATPVAADDPGPPTPGTIFGESRLGLAFSPDPATGAFPPGVSPPLIVPRPVLQTSAVGVGSLCHPHLPLPPLTYV